MIRLDLSAIPTRWHTVPLLDEQGEPQDARIRYALLSRDETAAYRRAEIELAARSVGLRNQSGDVAEERAFYAALIARLDPESTAERHEHLMRAITGWDFEASEGEPLPCTDEIKAAILNRADWFAPLWYGLLEASEGAGKKPARNG